MEFSLIEQLKTVVGVDSRIELGIGDDCAIIPGQSGTDLLITTDMLLDGVHFLTSEHSLEQIARKALAVNVSDIAAMAGTPVAAFLSVAFPRAWKRTQAEALLTACAHSAQEFHVTLAGGDTTTWEGPLAVNIALYGEVSAGKAVRRDRAQPGDLVCVSGPLGGSLLGGQFRFTPRVREAQWLNEHLELHALIDISDGLIADLSHILDASGVGAVLEAERIPITQAARNMTDSLTPLEHALSDGEDFELLWTMPEQSWQQFSTCSDSPVQIHPIGRIVTGSGWRLLDSQGNSLDCHTHGYIHTLKP